MHQDMKNYYEVLEIPLNSNDEEIKEGYIRAKNAFSGDSLALYSLMDPKECEEVIELIEEAFTILSHPEKRREYDKVRGYNQGNAEISQRRAVGFGSSPMNDKFLPPTPEPITAEKRNPFKGHSYQRPFEEETSSRREMAKKDFQINRKESEVSKIGAKNRFSIDFVVDQEMETKIENATAFSGELLKEIRDYRAVTIERLADMTKISKTYIRYIEEEKYEKLPALAYVRGFVYQYAKCLKLNPEIVANSYIHHIKTIKTQA